MCSLSALTNVFVNIKNMSQEVLLKGTHPEVEKPPLPKNVPRNTWFIKDFM